MDNESKTNGLLPMESITMQVYIFLEERIIFLNRKYQINPKKIFILIMNKFNGLVYLKIKQYSTNDIYFYYKDLDENLYIINYSKDENEIDKIEKYSKINEIEDNSNYKRINIYFFD
jgi:hypothetical protein